MKLISILAAGVTFVAAGCNDNEVYICPTGKKKASIIEKGAGVDNMWMTEKTSRNYKIQCPKDSYIEIYDQCESEMVSRTNTSWCEMTKFPQFVDEKASLPEFIVDEALATHYYRKKCDGRRSCKVNYKKDTKKMGAPKVSEVEIYLTWNCAFNDEAYTKKQIKSQRKAAVRANTADAMDSFWAWYHAK
jgi:hypothetical protein